VGWWDVGCGIVDFRLQIGDRRFEIEDLRCVIQIPGSNI